MDYTNLNDGTEELFSMKDKNLQKPYVGEVGERQLYVIPDSTMDTSTAVVKVFDNLSTMHFQHMVSLQKCQCYKYFYSISNIEAPNGYYELNFETEFFCKAPNRRKDNC